MAVLKATPLRQGLRCHRLLFHVTTCVQYSPFVLKWAGSVVKTAPDPELLVVLWCAAAQVHCPVCWDVFQKVWHCSAAMHAYCCTVQLNTVL